MSGRLSRNVRRTLEQLERRDMMSVGPMPWFRPGPATTITDDYGNTIAQSALVGLSTAGTALQSGKIEQAGDVDVFRFVAPVSGQMTIRQQSSRLETYVSAYDSSEQVLATTDGRLARSGAVQITVTAGSTYYLKVGARGRGIGAYTIQLSTTAAITDDYGNTLAKATAVTLSEAGAGAQAGKIEQSGDADMFSIVAPVSGEISIQQSAASGSRLDSVLAVYDASGTLIAQNDNNGTSRDSLIEFDAVAGATYYVKAAGRTGSTGAYSLAISTTASTGGGTTTDGGFQIDVTMTGMTTAQQEIIQQAVDRWEEIIVGDLPDVIYRGTVIDDVQIAISAITIDGEDGTLGQAAATAFRSDSELPYMGYIQLDTADVAAMLSEGSLLGVIEHELAHVLGFGVIWSDLGLLTGSNTSRPGFTGAQAVAEYNSLFGTSVTAVPVEADGGSGTRLSHWEESVFSNELMTGWYNSGQTNPISRITVASMADLGYVVNMAAADAYTPSSSVSTTSSSVVGNSSSARITAGIAASRARFGSSDSFFGSSSNDQLRAVDQVFGQHARGRI